VSGSQSLPDVDTYYVEVTITDSNSVGSSTGVEAANYSFDIIIVTCLNDAPEFSSSLTASSLSLPDGEQRLSISFSDSNEYDTVEILLYWDEAESGVYTLYTGTLFSLDLVT